MNFSFKSIAIAFCFILIFLVIAYPIIRLAIMSTQSVYFSESQLKEMNCDELLSAKLLEQNRARSFLQENEINSRYSTWLILKCKEG